MAVQLSPSLFYADGWLVVACKVRWARGISVCLASRSDSPLSSL